VFVAEKELKPGATYRVRLAPRGLKGVPDALTPYEFAVRVQEPALEVIVSGLSPASSNGNAHRDRSRASTNDDYMSLTGIVVTADVEDGARVEKTFTASYLGKPLAISWQHDTDQIRHGFTVSSIARQTKPAAVKLTWNGAAIAASSQGERSVDVPPRHQFMVTQAAALDTDSQRMVVVRFSDPLDTKQDLRGLVELSTGSFTSRIEDYVLKLYPERAPDGAATVTLQPGIRNAKGERLESVSRHSIAFASTRPQVRFAGRGIILPPSSTLAVPFEAVNVRAVYVTAFEVYEKNIGQFLQVNTLGGSQELARVGRNLWRKKLTLTAAEPGRWNRYNIDVSELFAKHPHALFQLTLSIRKADSTYACANSAPATDLDEMPPSDAEDNSFTEASIWDYAEE
jgi:hypothetical protein